MPDVSFADDESDIATRQLNKLFDANASIARLKSTLEASGTGAKSGKEVAVTEQMLDDARKSLYTLRDAPETQTALDHLIACGEAYADFSADMEFCKSLAPEATIAAHDPHLSNSTGKFLKRETTAKSVIAYIRSTVLDHVMKDGVPARFADGFRRSPANERAAEVFATASQVAPQQQPEPLPEPQHSPSTTTAMASPPDAPSTSSEAVQPQVESVPATDETSSGSTDATTPTSQTAQVPDQARAPQRVERQNSLPRPDTSSSFSSSTRAASMAARPKPNPKPPATRPADVVPHVRAPELLSVDQVLALRIAAASRKEAQVVKGELTRLESKRLVWRRDRKVTEHERRLKELTASVERVLNDPNIWATVDIAVTCSVKYGTQRLDLAVCDSLELDQYVPSEGSGVPRFANAGAQALLAPTLNIFRLERETEKLQDASRADDGVRNDVRRRINPTSIARMRAAIMQSVRDDLLENGPPEDIVPAGIDTSARWVTT